jgi:hypothetical protein
MDEQYFQDLLSAYLDNELTPEQKAAMDQYLASNQEARVQLARLERLNRLVDDHSGLGGEDYWEESASKIEQRLGIASSSVTAIEPELRKRSGLWWKVTSVAASVAVLIFIGLHQTEILVPDQPRKMAAPTFASPPSAPDTDHGTPVEDQHAESRAPVTTEPSQAVVPKPVRPEQKHAAESGEVGPDTADKLVSVSKDDLARVMTAREEQLTETEDATTQSTGQYQARPTPRQRPSVESDSGASASVSMPMLPSRKAVSAAPAEELSEVARDEESAGPGETGLSLNKSIGVPPDEYQQKEVGSSLASRETELARWRLVRDSLTGQLATASDSDVKPRTKAIPELTTQLKPSTGGSASEKRTDLERALADAWYNILIWSADSSEVKQGMEYLRQLAADSLSPSRDKAAGYLDGLKRREGPAFE